MVAFQERPDKPHAVCIPCAAQSHIKSMLKLAKLLHRKGPDAMIGLPNFRFESIPDGLPPSNENATQDVAALCEAAMKNLLAPFNELLDKLNDSASSNAPPVTCIVSDGSAVIFHTFDVLEQEVLNALYTMFPRVYTIGPLELLLNQKQEADLISVGCKLWKEVVECLHWLDSNKPRSVIYVNFGSIVTVTNEQLVEFGLGLAESGHQFLWIIRPDMVVVDSAILPPEYSEETKEVSFICSWCPQEEVLNHPSIGGFLTHSGWGSTIESISCGMPMLCWPFRGDQQTNSRYTCPEWGIGMEIDSNVKRENVKKLVLELMEGEKG
uniref:anthocyanidin 3-O-glucosyltransferase n=1 Tax=Salix viminalis TaxID=40686 RepID=A0A6N2KCQ0_SALVM